MKLNLPSKQSASLTLNMTPLIDIIFLLIVFFVIVYQFIDTDTLPVNLPENCQFASRLDPQVPTVTLSVTQLENSQTGFALDNEMIAAPDDKTLVNLLSLKINSAMDSTTAQPVIKLSIDKHVPYKKAKLALMALSKSKAQKIEFSTLKNIE